MRAADVSSRTRAVLGVLLVLVLAAAAAVVLVRRNSDDATAPAQLGGADAARSVTIPTAGGHSVPAQVLVPDGTGPFPLVVMPASWGATAAEYAYPARTLAARGFVVVSYAQPGFGGATGSIDLAGTATQQVVSTVIDWALEHTPAKASAIGAAGISYGAGISLLAAERDPRIKAVVALSGWTDLFAALAPDDTIAVQAVAALLTSSTVAGHLSPDVQRLVDDLAARKVARSVADLRALSATRSPIRGVGALNTRRTAVMLASGYQDSILPPGDLLPFYDALRGPKRLQLAPGDHGGPEGASLLGKPDATWDDAQAWLAHYLDGAAGGGVAGDPVRFTDAVTRTAHTYPSLAAMGTHTTTAYLSGATFGTAPDATLRASIASGRTSTAELPASQLDFRQTYRPATLAMSTLQRGVAAAWTAATLSAPQLISGQVRLRVTLRSTTADTSVFAYLYDVDAAGTGTLMTYAPITELGIPSGTAKTVDVAMQPISWTVAAGHHVALVLDTADARFATQPGGGTVTFSSSPSAPARLLVPTG